MRGLPICEGLKDRELGHLLQAFHLRTYHEDEPLFVEGDIGRALFVVLSGRVELTQGLPDGKTRRLAVAEPGALFGEMALLEQMPRVASATALETSELLLLYRSKLDELLQDHPRIGVALMSHLARLLSARLRRLSREGASEPAALGYPMGPEDAGKRNSPAAP